MPAYRMRLCQKRLYRMLLWKDYTECYSNETSCTISLELLFVLRNSMYSLPYFNVGWLKVHFR